MIQWLSAVLLGGIQGLTEFLPISSSAHLILLPKIFTWEDQGLSFDVAVHVGTLLAIIVYFRQPLSNMCKDFFALITGKQQTPQSLLMWQLLIATIPVGIAGLLFHHFIETYLRSSLVIAIATIGFGLLLGLSDSHWMPKKSTLTITWKQALLIGAAQILALIPGTSRSGITMTMALSLGLSRVQAATFSFYLAIPVIILAGGYESFKIFHASNTIPWAFLSIGASISFLSAFLCIHIFLKFIENIGMFPFVLYRIILGVLLLTFFV